MYIFAAGGLWNWLWSFGIEQAAVIAIALLSAFLTVVQVWQIPASTNSFAPPPAGGESAKESGSEKPNSLLQSNFTTTVLSGIGGMAAVSLLDSVLGQDRNPWLRSYYLILFVLFFLTFLLASALLRGATEALRSRIAIPYEIPAWETWETPEGGRIRDWFSYRGHRAWAWLLSQRTALLVFFDTAFNVLQGKNQLQSAVFSDRIVDLQWSLVKTADRVRESVAKEVLATLRHESQKKHGMAGELPDEEGVRVNIGVLSAGGSSVFYVSRDPKSLPRPFGRHSIAWLSIAAGVARWCKLTEDGNLVYPRETPLLLPAEVKDLTAGSVPYLVNYFEYRPEPGYRAFIVIPVPWMGRGEEGHHRKAGILISFEKPEYLDLLWDGLDGKDHQRTEPNYGEWAHLLHLKDQHPSLLLWHNHAPDPGHSLFIKNPGLHAALHQAVSVLEEVLSQLSDNIFEEVIRPQHES